VGGGLPSADKEERVLQIRTSTHFKRKKLRNLWHGQGGWGWWASASVAVFDYTAHMTP